MDSIKVTRRNTTNYRISVNRYGEVRVSVPLYATNSEIESFINKNQEWIKEAKIKAIDKTLFCDIKDNGYIYLLGTKLTIKVIISNNEYINRIDDNIYIYTKINEPNYFSNSLNNYINSLREDVYSAVLKRYLIITNENINKWEIKNMKMADGKCNFVKRIIYLSPTLIFKTIEYIEAVVLHEVAHLKHHDHGKGFYDYINLFMKDYKIRIKKFTY